MNVKVEGFYEVPAPRCTVLISTADKEGRANAAPFSFVMPVSSAPPLVVFAATPQRHTLANVLETGEFVLNIVPEELLNKLWICSKALPKGVSEIAEADLTERQSSVVRVPGIEECVGWIECRMETEVEAGDHVLVIGQVGNVEYRDEFVNRDGYFDVARAKPVMHIRGTRFIVAERETKPEA